MKPPAEEILRLGRKSRKKLTVKFLQIFVFLRKNIAVSLFYRFPDQQQNELNMI